jgi:DNA-binding NtrC family response regulator
VAVIVLTDAADVKTAIASLKLGAYAFLMKPINADELLITAARALERWWLMIERRQHQQADGQLQAADRTTQGRADLAQRDVLILVVEEEREIRKLLQQIFDSAGYRCLLAGDGEEGLKAFRESRPSLVITDLGMPMVRGGKSVRDAGIRLLLEIRQEDPNAAVIVASGAPEMRFVIESLKLGAYAFLMKPIIVDELLITAERALERRQLLVERRRAPTVGSAIRSRDPQDGWRTPEQFLEAFEHFSREAFDPQFTVGLPIIRAWMNLRSRRAVSQTDLDGLLERFVAAPEGSQLFDLWLHVVRWGDQLGLSVPNRSPWQERP